uniref:Uncharacterized protein n=1 Tax=Arcella intermedia TaxID=1963864 RepID=A0A6B2LVR1_9EUKA
MILMVDCSSSLITLSLRSSPTRVKFLLSNSDIDLAPSSPILLLRSIRILRVELDLSASEMDFAPSSRISLL